jgi:polyhydroxyalkanoate synthesis regulator phasin
MLNFIDGGRKYMVLSNKQHEQDQSRRIKKLESDLKQQKSRLNVLKKRVDSQQKEITNLKKKVKNL